MRVLLRSLMILAVLPNFLLPATASEPSDPLARVRARLDAIEAETVKLSGIQRSGAVPLDPVREIEQRLQGQEAILRTLMGYAPPSKETLSVDRFEAIVQRTTAVEAALTVLSGFKPSAAGALSGASELSEAERMRIEAIRESVLYCRWKDARDAANGLKKDLEKGGKPTTTIAEILDQVKSEEANPRLSYLYFTGITRRDESEDVRWDLRFASRPELIGGFRVNFYLSSNNRVVRVVSRWYQDLMRGEHVLLFHAQNAWVATDGPVVSARAELCYAGHVVDVITEGAPQAATWWKRMPIGSVGFINPVGHIATDGLLVGHEKTTRFWIADSKATPWSADSLWDTFHRLDGRQESEFKEEVPDEAVAAPLPSPCSGSRLAGPGTKSAKPKTKPAKTPK